MFINDAIKTLGSKLICEFLTLLHPGTTNTDLSRPFQGNVPEGKLFGVDLFLNYSLLSID
jgi:hypothetical protein